MKTYLPFFHGYCCIEGEMDKVKSITFTHQPEISDKISGQVALAYQQLDEYQQKKRKVFTFVYQPIATEFQSKVYEACAQVEYGETMTYQQIAILCNNPKAMRAVGQALHRNPCLIVVPCHRVIGKNGQLTGFGLGLDFKAQLLSFEQD